MHHTEKKKIKQVIFQLCFLKLHYFLTALVVFMRHLEADVVILRIAMRSVSPNFHSGRIKLMLVLILIAFVVSDI